MADEAPMSSTYLRRRLVSGGVADFADAEPQVATEVNRRGRAVSTVKRPRVGSQQRYHELDRMVCAVFKELPGCNGSYSIAGVSQEYEVEWDGILRPA